MNIYLLASGTLSVLLAVAHTWWGFANIYSEIARLNTTAGASLEGSFHQVGATLLVGGLALLIQGFRGYFSRAVPMLILAIYSVNFIVGLLIVLLKYPALVSQTVPQLFLYAVLFISLAVGIRAQKERSLNR